MEQLQKKLGFDPRMLSSSNGKKVKKNGSEAEISADANAEVADVGSKNAEIVEWQEHMEKAGEINQNSLASPEADEVVVAIDGLDQAVVPCVLQYRHGQYNAEMCTQEEQFDSRAEWAEEKSERDTPITVANS